MGISVNLRRLAGAMLLATSASAAPAATPDPLRAGFANPPAAARPRVWWHWMNGNVTKNGIAKDMAWMKRVGIGGLQNFDADLGSPQIVAKRLVYMHPDWKDAFHFAAQRADALGLELAIASSPGWSETGGPWVKPQDGLKKLVWSEFDLSGGHPFSGKLPAPPSITGPFQSIAFTDVLANGGPPKPSYYREVAVLAFPVNDPAAQPPSRIESSGQQLDAGTLTDESLETFAPVKRGTPDKPTTIELVYPAAQTIQSATIFVPGEVSPFAPAGFTPVLEASDGAGWRKVADLPLADVPTTVSFAPVTADRFRIVLGPNREPPRPGLSDSAPGTVPINFFPPPAADAPVKIAELRLDSEARVDRFESKAGFAIAPDYYALSKGLADAPGVRPDEVVNLTVLMKPDGSLDWTPPPGRWRVLRLGYSLLGTTNHPATAEATGLEVDKYDAGAVRNYLETYLAMYQDASGGLIGKRGVRALLTDSIEVGAANWTPRMIDQFKRLRGYDPIPWLPALVGTVVGSRSQSDRFLYDFRRTIADLMASEHYGTVAAVAQEHQLKLYGEALEDVRPSLGDDMTMRKYTDIPMAALWSWSAGSGPRPTLIGDMKGASSVAHVYGQNLAAAESMTAANAPWAFAPSDLRKYIDLEFASGINRPVIHTSVHQPTDDKLPGLSLAIFGQYFNRHESWAEMARPWVDYIARNSFLLQQGRNVADVAYFYGEEAPLTAQFAHGAPADLPTHYAYDFVSADALLNALAVSHGELVSSGGARYRALYLGGTSRRMTLPALRRIAALTEAGATVIGSPPVDSPSLNNDPAEFDTLKKRLWSGKSETAVGKGRVLVAANAEAGLAARGIAPDFTASGDGPMLFVHRRVTAGDLYFVNNRTDAPRAVEARFRVAGKQPEIWHADTGQSEPVSYRIDRGQTVVPLRFGPQDSYFVVFRKSAPAQSRNIASREPTPVAAVAGRWTVTFQPGRGAPASTRLLALGSLSDQADPAIKYFSGIATYRNRFTLPARAKAAGPLWLDLGRVGDLAEVRVNGKLVGTTWHAPYRLDIHNAVKLGVNRIEIRVADLWVNRLIGDAQPGAAKITWTPLPTYLPNAPLRPSGLIGPVTLLALGR